MDINRIMQVYRAVRKLFLYNDYRIVLSPTEISAVLNKGSMGGDIEPHDVMAALAYGMLCDDGSIFDIQIRYRRQKSRTAPAATFTFDGKPVRLSRIKRIARFEKRYGEIDFKEFRGMET